MVAEKQFKELRAVSFAVSVDVRVAKAVSSASTSVVKEAGGLHILISNVGTNVRKRPDHLEATKGHTAMETNVTSAFLCSKACYPNMKQLARESPQPRLNDVPFQGTLDTGICSI